MQGKDMNLFKTHKTAVVAIPPETSWSPIQAIRAQHDRGFSRWMPHITLLYPFRPRHEFETAAMRLAQMCERIPSFEVSLASFSFFQHGAEDYTLWLAPEPKEILIALQAALWEVFPDCDDVNRFENGFTPHLSVAQVRSKETLERLVDTWETAWTPIRFQISAVSLIWQGDPPDDVFRVGKTVALAVT